MAETLAAKVATFPAAMSDWSVADTLNTPDSAVYGTKRQVVPTQEIARILLMTGTTAKLERFIQWTDLSDAAKQSLAEACVTTLKMIRELPDVRAHQAPVYTALATISQQLVDGGLMAAATRTKLLALADVPRSWADVNNGGIAVTASDVETVRRAA
jgi:hypothetical protein